MFSKYVLYPELKEQINTIYNNIDRRKQYIYVYLELMKISH